MLRIVQKSFLRIKYYEHCEGKEKYENISVFLVFFLFAHLQIFRLYSTEGGDCLDHRLFLFTQLVRVSVQYSFFQKKHEYH